jgi:hypothetical protein
MDVATAVDAIIEQHEKADNSSMVCVTRSIGERVADALQARFPKRMIMAMPIMAPGESHRERGRLVEQPELEAGRDVDAAGRRHKRISAMRDPKSTHWANRRLCQERKLMSSSNGSVHHHSEDVVGKLVAAGFLPDADRGDATKVDAALEAALAHVAPGSPIIGFYATPEIKQTSVMYLFLSLCEVLVAKGRLTAQELAVA